MRYRLMASYLGASYQAAVGPSDRDVTLFAAPPPPEEHGFSPVPGGGIWRKQVPLDDLDGLWESRPVGSYHGEPCLVLDDLGDRLHIVYLGMDERRAGQLGYWQVDRGVFEVVVQRHEVTDLAEERHEFPVALLLSALPRASASPRALNAGDGGADSGPGFSLGRMALSSGGQGPSGQGPSGQGPSAQVAGSGQVAGGRIAAWNGQPATARAAAPQAPPQAAPPQAAPPQAAPPQAAPPQAPGAPQVPVASQQPANAQPPAAVVAWHGSPVPDGNGTWYYQPNIDPQNVGGTTQNGISQNGISQNGLAVGRYAPLEQGTPSAAESNGLTATPQFAQPAPAAGYQTPPLQFQPPAVAPAPLADAGTTGTTGGMSTPVNLGMPLSAQVPAPSLATPPIASAAPAAPAPPAAPVPPTVSPAETRPTDPLPAVPMPAPVSAPPPTPIPTSAAPVDQSPRPGQAGPLGRLTGAVGTVRGRRAARKPRLAMSAIFADLVDMADVPRSSYSVDEEVTGAMCLFKTDGGYEVFSCAEDARHEVRFFEDEEAAYFYLFGVLAAEALRNGRLTPRRG